jgi:hypothetical protein
MIDYSHPGDRAVDLGIGRKRRRFKRATAVSRLMIESREDRVLGLIHPANLNVRFRRRTVILLCIPKELEF